MVIYVTSNHYDASSNLVVSTHLITQILIQLNYIYKLLLIFLLFIIIIIKNMNQNKTN